MLGNNTVEAMDICQLQVDAILGNPLKPRFNVYDIREKCTKPPLCYDFSTADNLLNSASVQKELGVSGKWVECSKKVHLALLLDWMTDLSSKITGILAKKKIDVLAYHGDKDFICNWRGGEAWTNAVEWPGHDSFNSASYSNWTVNGVAAGQLKNLKTYTS